MEPREGPVPGLVVRQRHAPRPAAGSRPAAWPPRACRRASCPDCASGWPRRSAGSRHRSGRTIPTSTSTTTSATSRCPQPGTERTLFDLAAVLAAAPLDRTRPLWEFTIIDGLGGGGAALFQKIHHTVTDGEGGVRMSAEFIDFSREGAARRTTERRPHASRTIGRRAGAERSSRPRAGDGVAQPPARARARTAGRCRRGRPAPPPGAHPGRRIEVVASVQSLARQAAVTDRAHSPLWTERSLRRRFEVLRIPLDDTKRAAEGTRRERQRSVRCRRGGCGRRVSPAKGVDVDELRISMPVSTRTDRFDGWQRIHTGTSCSFLSGSPTLSNASRRSATD